MSLAIDTESVTHVLLADGWHRVSPESFALDAYEFMEGDATILRGGQVAGVPSMGFRFLDRAEGSFIEGPLTSILAMRTNVSKTGRQ